MFSYEVIGINEKEATSLYNFAKRKGFEPSKNVENTHKIIPGSRRYYTVSSKYSDFSECVCQWYDKHSRNLLFSRNFYKTREQVKGI